MSDETRHIANLAGLSAMPALPPGTRIFVEEDGRVYNSIGNTTPEIAARLGWTQENVWMPDHVWQWIRTRHGILHDPVTAASVVLMNAASVHADTKNANAMYFIVEADILRNTRLLGSRSARYVDAVVELRHVPGGAFLRLYHLSPRNWNQGGRQIWP